MGEDTILMVMSIKTGIAISIVTVMLKNIFEAFASAQSGSTIRKLKQIIIKRLRNSIRKVLKRFLYPVSILLKNPDKNSGILEV